MLVWARRVASRVADCRSAKSGFPVAAADAGVWGCAWLPEGGGAWLPEAP